MPRVLYPGEGLVLWEVRFGTLGDLAAIERYAPHASVDAPRLGLPMDFRVQIVATLFHGLLDLDLNTVGFGKRIMFGTDQMVWPAALPRAIEAIEAADFLTPEQKRDIFCNNAAQFLRLQPNLCD